MARGPAKNDPPKREPPADPVDTAENEQATESALVALKESNDFASIDEGLAIAQVREEIDIQIATAHKFPRSMALAVRAIIELATYDSATASEMTYALPRAGKAIVGPSVRFAELVAQQWGNNRAFARVVEVNRREGYVEAYGAYLDLQSNSFTSETTRRRIKDSKGRVYDDDMIIVTGNAARSIAMRNSILRGVPKPIWRIAYEKALDVNRGDAASLGKRRQELLRAFKDMGIKPAQVYALAGVPGEQDIGLDEIVIVGGYYNALKSGEATLDELLGRPLAQNGAGLSDAFKGAKAEADPPNAGSGGAATTGAPTGTGGSGPASGAAGSSSNVTDGKTAGGATHDPQTGEVIDPEHQTHISGEKNGQGGQSEPETSEPASATADQDVAQANEPERAGSGAQPDLLDEPTRQKDDGDVYRASLAEAPDVKSAIAAFALFRQTATYAALDDAGRADARASAWAGIAAVNPELKPYDEPAVFALWLDWAVANDAKGQIKPMFRELVRTPAYTKPDGLSQEQRDEIAQAVMDAIS